MALQFGYRLALIAFATATLRGALTGTDFEGTLNAALVAGVAFFVLGIICGELARRVVEEQVEAEFEKLMSGTERPAPVPVPELARTEPTRRAD